MVNPLKKTNSKAKRKAKGKAHLKKDWCKECRFCIEFCPGGVLAVSDEFNALGYHPPIIVDESKCTGCELCGMLCPEFAIWSTKT